MHRGMWPGYTFSRFHEHFFAFVGIKLFLAFCPFSKRTEACDPVIFFLVFMGDLKKVIEVNFRSVVHLKYKKLVKKKFSFPAIKKKLDFNKKRV